MAGLFYPYVLPAGTCMGFASDRGFFLPLNSKTEANTHVSLGLFNCIGASLHIEGMEERFLLYGGLRQNLNLGNLESMFSSKSQAIRKEEIFWSMSLLFSFGTFKSIVLVLSL